MASERKGTLFADWWVHCGLCGEQEVLATHSKAVATQEIKKLGYKRTKAYGLVCKECQKEEIA